MSQDIEIIGSPPPTQTLLNLKVTFPSNTPTTIQFSSDLLDWHEYGHGLISPTSGTVETMVPTAPGLGMALVDGPHLFYRSAAHPVQVEFVTGSTSLCVEVSAATTLQDLLLQAIVRLGVDMVLPAGVSPDQLVQPGTYCGPSLSYILSDLGIPSWEQVPAVEDDSVYSNQFPGVQALQTNGLPDGPRSTNTMDDGFPPDPMKPDPLVGEGGVPSPQNDKGFIPNVDPAAPEDEQVPLPVIDPAAHYRLEVAAWQGGGITGQWACKYAGSALLPAKPGPIDPDSLVMTVSSPDFSPGTEGNVFFMDALSDPWVHRGYSGDSNAPHDNLNAEDTLAHFFVPLPLGQTNMPPDLTARFYRVVGNVDIDLLTPGAFYSNEASMVLLGEITGPEFETLCDDGGGGGASGFEGAGGDVSQPSTLSNLVLTGHFSTRFNIVIAGDGFANTPGDQAKFNGYVQTNIVEGLFDSGLEASVLEAINLYRVNTYSVDSGVTQISTNATNGVVVTVARNTALEYRFSGLWDRCWMEHTPPSMTSSGTLFAINRHVRSLAPWMNFLIIVLNETGSGGCAPNQSLVVTLSTGASTLSHEFGHMFGGLGDEYLCSSNFCTTIYNNGPVSRPNLADWSQLRAGKWSEWVPGWRPVPTVNFNVSSETEDVGYFHGATLAPNRYLLGLFRPTSSGRMNENWRPHNPIGDTAIRNQASRFARLDFLNYLTGDLNANGRTDAIFHHGKNISTFPLYTRVLDADPVLKRAPRPSSYTLNRSALINERVERWTSGSPRWSIAREDTFVTGDFNGDNQDDLFAINFTTWTSPSLGMLRAHNAGLFCVARYDGQLPGWGDIRANDKFFTGDFNDDGKDDLFVFNGKDWSIPYLLILKSTGTNLVFHRRYDRFLPGWAMGARENFYTGDFDGDGILDLLAHNTKDWARGHLHIYRSNGSDLQPLARHYGDLPAWTLRDNDQLIVLPNPTDDQKDQIAFFNGEDWDSEYLLLTSVGSTGSLTYLNRYRDIVDFWNMRSKDRYLAADVDGSLGPADLVVLNAIDWTYGHLGILNNNAANGTLVSRTQQGWIDGWMLGPLDQITKVDFSQPIIQIRGPMNDLFISNPDYFGLLRSVGGRFVLDAIYYKWITSHRYHQHGLW